MNCILTLTVFVIVLLLWKLYDTRKYWTKIGVKQLPFPDIIRSVAFTRLSFPDSINRVYKRFSKDRYAGIYRVFSPILMIIDLDLIRQLTVKDFDHFTDHFSVITDVKYEPLWPKNLFVLKGKQWRHMRATLSPAFTSSKMKAIFNLMIDCANRFTQHFEQNNSGVVEVDLKDIFSRYANDVIGTCAFGVQCNSLEQKENDFFMMGKQATNFSGLWRRMQLTLLFLIPNICKHIGIKFIPTKVNEFFIKLVEDTVNYREEHNIIRPDMIHLLMEARKGQLKYEENEKKVKETGFATVEESNIGTVNIGKEEITTEDMTAQVFIFFFAGFDTISTLMSFLGYELSINPDIQQRLFEEIGETYHHCNGNVTYDALSKMTYFDMVVSETLRKWPPIVTINRVCTAPYTIQPERETEVPVKLKKDDIIWIPTYAIHHDPKYYPNPEKFDPERFNENNKDKINPYTYIPFGVGPRNCIASRFALLEVKALYFYLLHEYEIVVTEKTPIPLFLRKSGFVLAPERKFMLALMKR